MHRFLLPAALAAVLVSPTHAGPQPGVDLQGRGEQRYEWRHDAAREHAPLDGWAAMNGGTVGGAQAAASQIYTVSNRAQLLSALAGGGNQPKIVRIDGTIDMSEGVPYTGRADQSARGTILIPPNTTLIGGRHQAGIVNGSLVIRAVSQVIVRNLKIVAPCDVAPVFDPNDGAGGSWNAAFDAISIVGAHNVWIDHNTITDAPLTDDLLPIENGQPKQCHDGAIDITNASDFVTVSYNVIEQHDKTSLIGSSDSAIGDAGRLRVTFSNNVLRDVKQRAPRVRFGQVHLFNNYFEGSKTATPYAHSYSIGIGRAAQVISHANVFAVDGAASCDAVVTTLGADATSGFADTGSLLNRMALGACSAPATIGWSVPYRFGALPAQRVKAHALSQAGVGKIRTKVRGSGGMLYPPGTLVPARHEARAHVDTTLSLAFDGPPTLGTAGTITVYRASDNVVVDRIDISTAPSASDTQTVIARTNLEIDAIGLGAIAGEPARARWVWYRPVEIDGNTAIIRLHDNKLAHGTAYYVSVDAGVLNGSVNGSAFTGISGAGGWRFTTRAAPGSPTHLIVDDDGPTADFRSLQGALNWVMRHCTRGAATAAYGCNTAATQKRVTLRPGIYRELNLLRDVDNLTIEGEDRDGVIVGDDNFESLNRGSGASALAAGTDLTTTGRVIGHRILGGGRASFLVENSDLLSLRGFTLDNPHERAGIYDNQAEALYFNTSTTAAAARMEAREMNFLSQQDTLQLKGYVWVWRSLVAGNVDFIWGNVMAALFEQSEIRSVFDPASSSPGYILQARATPGDKGFVFLDSTLTAGPGVTQAYLARSGGTATSTYIDNIAFIGTRMGPHILPVGWCNGTGTSRTGTGSGSCGSNPPPWSGTADGGATDTAGWREHDSMDLAGAPLNTAGRLGLANVRVGGVTRSVTLAKTLDSTSGLATRADVFYNSTAATGSPGGWVPLP